MIDPTLVAVVQWDLQQFQAVKIFQLEVTANLLPQLSPQNQQTLLGYTFQLAALESYFFGVLLPEIVLFNQP